MLNLSVENLLHSNIFNFCIMIVILAFIAKKVKVSELIEANRAKIEDTVNDSVTEKENSHEELKEAELSVKNTVTEIESIVDTAKKNLKSLEEKIEQDTKKQVENIESNVSKVVDFEASKLTSKLSRGVSSASVALSKVHIRKMLAENSELHNKFIDDSIEELDKVNI